MPCTICGNPKVLAKGWCNKHYKRWYRGADQLGPDRRVAILNKHHPFYVAWTNMKTRCNNPNSTQYKWYGGRGITICKEWDDFEVFYNEMFPTWQIGLELDRRDNNSGYCSANCRWVTHAENCQNRGGKFDV